ncbi:MAG: hypothetical protein AAF715_17340 [Myxococcota bacterium]
MRRLVPAAVLPFVVACSLDWAVLDPREETASMTSSGLGGGSSSSGSLGAGAGDVGGSGVGGRSCVAERVATPIVVPLQILLFLDGSGSMNSNGVWADVVDGITDYLEDAAGVEVALNVFPQSPEPCAASTYDPPTVGLTALPSGASSLSCRSNR